MIKNLKLEREVFVKEDREEVWKVLTTPEYTKRFMFNSEVETDWKKGSEIKWRGNFLGHRVYSRGIVLECIPNEYVKYSSFDPALGFEDVPENYIYISFILTPKDGGTEVKFVIENPSDNKELYDESVKGLDKVMVPGFKKIFKIR